MASSSSISSSAASSLKRACPSEPDEQPDAKRISGVAQSALSALADPLRLPDEMRNFPPEILQMIDRYADSWHLQMLYHRDALDETMSKAKAERVLTQFGIHSAETNHCKKTSHWGLERAIFPNGYEKEPQFGLILAVLNHEDMRKMLHQELIIQIFDWIEKLHGEERDLSPIISLLLSKSTLSPLTLERLWERAREKKNYAALKGLFERTHPSKMDRDRRADAMDAAQRNKDLVLIKRLVDLPIASPEERGLALWGATLIGNFELAKELNKAAIPREYREMALVQAIASGRKDFAKSFIRTFPDCKLQADRAGEALIASLQMKDEKLAYQLFKANPKINSPAIGKALIAAVEGECFEFATNMLKDKPPIPADSLNSAIQLVMTARHLHKGLLQGLLYPVNLKERSYKTAFEATLKMENRERFQVIMDSLYQVKTLVSRELQHIFFDSIKIIVEKGHDFFLEKILAYSRFSASSFNTGWLSRDVETLEDYARIALACGHTKIIELLFTGTSHAVLRIEYGKKVEDASAKGELETVKYLLIDLCRITGDSISKYSRGRAAVRAAEAGHFPIVHALFSDPSAISQSQKIKLLLVAAKKGNLEVAQMCLLGDHRLTDFGPALAAAIENENFAIAEAILARPQIHIHTNFKNAMIAAIKGSHSQIATQILRYANFSLVFEDMALELRSFDIAEEIANRRGGYNKASFQARCLFHAAKSGRVEVVKAVLAGIAEESKEACIAAAVLQTIEQGGTLDSIRCLFADRGALPDQLCLSSAMAAAKCGREEIAAFFLSESSSVSLKAVLVEAAKAGHFQLVNNLAKGDEGILNSPEIAYQAALRGHAPFIEELLDRNPSNTRMHGDILHAAIAYSQIHIVHSLSKKGLIQPAALQAAWNSSLAEYKKLTKPEVRRYLSPNIPTEEFLYIEMRELLFRSQVEN